MDALGPLLAAAGHWTGTNRLWLSPPDPADESASALTVTALLNDTFVRLDQTWAFQGKPRAGSLLIGHDPKTGAATLHWIDTFHMGRGALASVGVVNADGTVDVRGSYAAPTGPAWGWRTTVAAAAPDRLEIVMFNVTPLGEEQMAVRATYSRP